ncbi:glutaredoxin domain-containing protein [Paenibacillus polymyxa]|uniref:glutaredoxin domain-containing protein n=1 Tax=Paenibacillus polymyxa TaxID=1406 RepID=UPI0005CE3C3F|nr:glutaredoxin domain-containing protein [Paenibacillus polymyxa]KJD38722.1 hypothetical protein QD46_18070 [Paenibacillus polymyxa]MEE4580495.1 glutaredoxin domain-containing protein [Paenibacillus polymyxa]
MRLNWYNKNRSSKVEHISFPVQNFFGVSIRSLVNLYPYKYIAALRFNSDIEIIDIANKQCFTIKSPFEINNIQYIAWCSKQESLFTFTDGEMVGELKLDFWKKKGYFKQVSSNPLTHFTSLSYLNFMDNSFIDLNYLFLLNRILSDLPQEISAISISGNRVVIGTINQGVWLLEDNKLKVISDKEKDINIAYWLDNGSFITCSKDTYVTLWKFSECNWNKYILGKHTGWIYDCVYLKKDQILYTAGADGVICKWSLNKLNLCISVPINKGIVSAVCQSPVANNIITGNYNGSLTTLANQSGEINQVPHMNSIWNFYYMKEKQLLYSVGADSTIICTDNSTGQIKNRLKCQSGWINGLDYDSQSESIIAVSSNGEIIFWNINDDCYQTVKIPDYWMNNIKVSKNLDYMFIATAEGDILIINKIDRCIHKRLDYHQDQILDIVVDEANSILISISIDGKIVIWDLLMERIIYSFVFPRFHPTSLTLNNKHLKVLISSLEGDLAVVSLNDDYQIAYLNNAHEGRIWKVSSDSTDDFFVTIATDKKLKLWSLQEFIIIKEWSDDTLFTSCLIEDKKIFFANQDGEYGCIEREEESITKIVDRVVLVQDRNSISIPGVYNDLFNHSCLLITDIKEPMNKAYVERVKIILNDLKLEYEIYDLSEYPKLRDITYHYSGWSHYPQVFFYGKFIGAGSVLLEMYRNGTLRRLIDQYIQIPSNSS